MAAYNNEEEDFLIKLSCDHVLQREVWKVIFIYAERWESELPSAPIFKLTKPIYVSDINKIYKAGTFIKFSIEYKNIIPTIVADDGSFRPRSIQAW